MKGRSKVQPRKFLNFGEMNDWPVGKVEALFRGLKK